MKTKTKRILLFAGGGALLMGALGIGLVVLVLSSRFFDSAGAMKCTWKTEKCAKLWVTPDRCISWDDSFQDLYYFHWVEGRPQKNFCQQLQASPEQTEQGSKDNWCEQHNAALFAKVPCPSHADADDCYRCNFQHSGDEYHEVVLGYRADCSYGFAVTFTGDAFHQLRQTQVALAEGCGQPTR